LDVQMTADPLVHAMQSNVQQCPKKSLPH